MQYVGFVGSPDMGDMNLDNMENMAKMGVALGVINNVINTNGDVFPPLTQGEQAGLSPANWKCSCGCNCTSGNFCTNCGAKRPSRNTVWNCTCGMYGLTTNFCTNCGAKRS